MIDDTGDNVILLFEGDLSTDHRMVIVEHDFSEPPEPFGYPGQHNGLCAERDSSLVLTTGLHTGRVRFRVELLDAAPGSLGDWEEVVEASFLCRAGQVWIHGLMDGGPALNLAEGVQYRVRYSGTGLDDGFAQDANTGPGHEAPDHYLLQFWPAAWVQDAVLRCTGNYARQAHTEVHPDEPTGEPAESATRPPTSPAGRSRQQPGVSDPAFHVRSDSEITVVPLSPCRAEHHWQWLENDHFGPSVATPMALIVERFTGQPTSGWRLWTACADGVVRGISTARPGSGSIVPWPDAGVG